MFSQQIISHSIHKSGRHRECQSRTTCETRITDWYISPRALRIFRLELLGPFLFTSNSWFLQSDHIIFTEMVNLFSYYSYRRYQKKTVIWKSFHFVIHPIIICTGYLYNWRRKQYTFHYARYCVLASSVWYVCNPSLKLQEEIERTPPLCIIMPHTAQLDHTSDNITRLEVEA